MPESISKQKDVLRQKYRELRDSLSTSYRLNASQNIAEQLHKLLLSHKITSVGLYWPINSEVDIRSLMQTLEKVTFSLPAISTNEEMVFLKCSKNTEMVKSKFAFHEPKSNKEIIPEAVIVPLITCDKMCNRIGYGKGFYDKYLRKHEVLSIGVCYQKTIHPDSLPKEPHDVPLHIVVSETHLYSKKT